MKNIVITGASQGIGLELTRQALASPQTERVLACARHPEKSAELESLRTKYPRNLQVVAADVAAQAGVARIVNELKTWSEVDVLINNAGIYPKGESLEDFLQGFQINSIAPFLLSRALFDWLKKSRAPRAVHITSLMGSMSDNTSGGHYAYRASKAALNMIGVSMARDEPWLTTLLIHPGWVRTQMGGAEAPTLPADSASGIWQITRAATAAQSGCFVDFEGDPIGW